MATFPKDDKVSFLDIYNESLEDSTIFKRLYAKYTKTKLEKSLPDDIPGIYRYQMSPIDPSVCINFNVF